jgi:hypothetical protein
MAKNAFSYAEGKRLLFGYNDVESLSGKVIRSSFPPPSIETFGDTDVV